MRRHVRLASILLPLALGPGCSDDGNTGNADLAVPPDLAVKVRPDMWMPTGCIKGSIKDEQDHPVANVSVLNCTSSICTTGTAGADSTFNTCGIATTDVAVKIEEECDHTPRYGAALTMVTIKSNGETVDAGALWVPIMGPGVPLDTKGTKPVTLEGGDGVSVTLTGTDLLLISAPACNTIFSARSLLPGKRGVYPVPDGSELLGVYVMSPFSVRSKSKTKFPMTAKLPAAQTPGATVKFWTFDYDASAFSSTPAMGKVDANDPTLVATNPGDGVGQLSYILVSK